MNNSSTCSAAIERRALRSIAWQFWLNGILFAAFVPRLPELRDQLGISLEQLGQGISFAMLGGIVGSLTVDYFCRRMNIKILMMVSAVSLILCLIFIGYTKALWPFAIIFALMATLDVYVDVTMNIQGSQLSERMRKPVMNRLHGLWSVGTVFGSVSAVIAISLGWSIPQQLTVIAVFSGFLLVYIWLGLKQPLNTEGSAKPAFTATKSWPLMLVFAILGAAAIIPEMVSSDWSAFRLRDDLGQTNKMASFGFVAFGSGMMLGRLGGDEVMYRLGQNRTITLASWASIVGICMVAFIDHWLLVFAGLALSGIGIAIFFPTLYDYAVKASGRGATMLGAMTIGSRLGAAGLPITVGYMSTWQGVWAAYAFLALPAIALIFAVTKFWRIE